LDESKEIEGEYLEEGLGNELAGQICRIRGGFGEGMEENRPAATVVGEPERKRKKRRRLVGRRRLGRHT
jgi:hypothetical protein